MRITARFPLRVALGVLVALALPAVAQETNFSTGPQYLLNGSPLFARPIATPSLSLETPLQPPTDHNGSEPAVEQAAENKLQQLPPLDFSSTYYKPPTAEEILISSGDSGTRGESLPLPGSIVESGVTEMIDPGALTSVDMV
jgi:hypothetical protein